MMAFGVAEGTKVPDPRGDRAIVSGLGERPRRIAEAVLTVIAGDSSATEQPGDYRNIRQLDASRKCAQDAPTPMKGA
jgi:hypothetical protein